MEKYVILICSIALAFSVYESSTVGMVSNAAVICIFLMSLMDDKK